MKTHFVQLARLASWLLLMLSATMVAADASRFAAGKHGAAELQFIDGLPVVTVAGSPEEIGEQLGTLMKRPINALMDKQDEFARGFGLGASVKHLRSGLARLAGMLAPAFPDSQRRELAATAKASGVDLDVLTLGNLMYELSQFPACSTLGVEPTRSASGNAMLGRNLDFPTFGFLDKYSVVVIYRPAGKRAFASVAFPGFVGVASGMNDAGLCVAQLEVNRSAESAPRLNVGGTPVAMCFRRLLEECATIDEAEKLLREQKRLIMCNLAICDKQGTAVLEITPKSVVRRPAEQGLTLCTNHFRTEKLCVGKECWRYDRLTAGQKSEKLTLGDVAKLLDSANQGDRTIQTMIFEPAKQQLHLSIGPLPSSSQPLKTLELAELFAIPAK